MVRADLRDKMRMLWEEHIAWTRMTIISIAENLSDLDLVTKRLLRNATDMANAFRPFYGDRIASEFGRLMKEHLVIAAELVKAAKAGQSQAAADAERRWYAKCRPNCHLPQQDQSLLVTRSPDGDVA
ncbi:MAG: hypothetical protein PHC60_09345 [Heliobacteriaceae bacterium]|nr:hypothetical protein [Heliobacteriaceae bacterium]